MSSRDTPGPAPSGAPRRWEEMLLSLAGLLPAGAVSVLVEGDGEQPALLAGRLAGTLAASGRACVRLTGAANGSADEARAGGDAGTDGHAQRSGDPAEDAVWLADGPGWRADRSWDVVIWLRAGHAGTGTGGHGGLPAGHAGQVAAGHGGVGGEDEADVVIDMHDQDWPVIRRVARPLATRGQWYLTETRAFFSCRAATWNTRFGDDMPAYAAAVAQAGIRHGGVVIDIGCGTGRALPALREAVGPDGVVIAADLTPEMIAEARRQSTGAHAALVLADARRLPFADASADALFAAGLVDHLPDTEAGLTELARVTRPGGLLVLFHPSGRAALAARHGRALTPDEPLAADPLNRSTAATGWRLTAYDDAADRFFALAVRC